MKKCPLHTTLILLGYLSLWLGIGPLQGQNGCDKKCYAKKPYIFSTNPTTIFNVKKEWDIDNVSTAQPILVLDVLQNDGIPEIIIAGPNNVNVNTNLANEILIINTKTKSIERTIKTAYFRIFGMASYIVADINNDCKKEIIVATSTQPLNPDEYRAKLICYDLDGNIIWISDQKYGKNIGIHFDFDPGIILADFNQDGISEVVVYNEIFNAQTGVKLIDGGMNGMGEGSELAGESSYIVAADLDDDKSNIELAAGYTVYKVAINNINGESGNIMTPINLGFKTQYIGLKTHFIDGATAVAD